jgi:hypothetical protein
MAHDNPNPHKANHFKSSINLTRFTLLIPFILIFLTGCNELDPETNTVDESATLSSEYLIVDKYLDEYTSIRKAWSTGPHANTYGLEKGPNTYCARCHAPQNWDPGAVIDPPPNCVTCKFPFEDTMRIAQGNIFINENDWHSIGCNICHSVSTEGEIRGISWLDTRTGYYETLETSTELCEQCHRDTETLRHQRQLGEHAHQDFTCTHCHNPHTGLASCSTPGCHVDISSSHEIVHPTVTCEVCHDAAGYSVDFDQESQMWVVLRTTEVLGRASTSRYQSHNLQKTVDCARCHHPNNPWSLPDHH